MKRLVGFCMIGLLLGTGTAYSLDLPDLDTATFPLRGESDLNRDGRTAAVDWIVSKSSLTSQISESSFKFAFDLVESQNQGAIVTKGDYVAYSEESTWYYYYQVENYSGNFGTSFSLKLDPSLVISAGYILNVDLDTDLDLTHLDTDDGLAGEREPAGTSIVNFTSASFDSDPPTPNVSLNFFPGLSSGYESAVFFITSNSPPEYLIAELLSGPAGPLGELPIPTFPDPPMIPEPASLLLLGGASVVALRLKKNRK